MATKLYRLLTIYVVSNIILTIGFTGSTLAKSLVYVSDQINIPVRSEQGQKGKIIDKPLSGQSLELLERTDTGWTKVKTPNGDIGWIISRYLMNTPAARDKLEVLNGRYNANIIQHKQQSNKLTSLELQFKSIQTKHQALLIDKDKITAKVKHIEQAYKNSLKIDHENLRLRSKILQLNGQIQSLKNNKDNQNDRSSRNWFIVGALVLLVGGIIGGILAAVFNAKKTENRW